MVANPTPVFNKAKLSFLIKNFHFKLYFMDVLVLAFVSIPHTQISMPLLQYRNGILVIST